jgi:uncharacterized membrane protein YgcG
MSYIDHRVSIVPGNMQSAAAAIASTSAALLASGSGKQHKKRGASSVKMLSDLENYYSPSVTDLFTILHELLQTILIFDTENSDLNLPQQMCFVNLIKSKLLTYSVHIKKQYNKIYRAGSVNYNQNVSKTLLNTLSVLATTGMGGGGGHESGGGGHGGTSNRSLSVSDYSQVSPANELTITSCILMNNFQKTVELLDEIQLKLTAKSELKQAVIDQLESIKVILREDLDNMVNEYAGEYQRPFIKICQFIQVKIYSTFNAKNPGNASHANNMNASGAAVGGGNDSSFDLNKSISMMTNLIDETLYNMLNEKFMICKIVLFDPIFKQLLEAIFKILVKCIEDWVILKPETSGESGGGGGDGGAGGAKSGWASGANGQDSVDVDDQTPHTSGSGISSYFGQIGKYLYSTISWSGEQNGNFF